MQKNIRVLSGMLIASMLTTCLLAGPTSRSFSQSFENQLCKGTFNASIFARLDRICLDCHNQYTNAPSLYTQCGENCFTSDYFEACLESLRIKNDKDEMRKIQNGIKQLHGSPPVIFN